MINYTITEDQIESLIADLKSGLISFNNLESSLRYNPVAIVPILPEVPAKVMLPSLQDSSQYTLATKLQEVGLSEGGGAFMQLRAAGNYKGNAYFISHNNSWKLVKDDTGYQVLVPNVNLEPEDKED